jgi:hypothetical protein
MSKEHFFDKHVINGRSLELHCRRLEISSERLYALNKKRILLVGGGRAPIFSGLKQQKICPEILVNIDPYVFAEEDNDNKHIKNIKHDFMKYEIAPDSFDEIWALFSLPYYCKSADEATKFYAKALLATAPEGYLRVYPSYPSVAGSHIIHPHEEFLEKLSKAFPNIGMYDDPSICGSVIRHMPKEKAKINKWLIESIASI